MQQTCLSYRIAILINSSNKFLNKIHHQIYVTAVTHQIDEWCQVSIFTICEHFVIFNCMIEEKHVTNNNNNNLCATQIFSLALREENI